MPCQLRHCPATSPILKPGMKAESAVFPMRRMTEEDWHNSTSAMRRGRQDSNSAGSGLLSSLVRSTHPHVFVMRSCSRCNPASESSSSSNFPARPTNGLPCLSSSRPGASPTRRMRASQAPLPSTHWRPKTQLPKVQLSITASRPQRSCPTSSPRQHLFPLLPLLHLLRRDGVRQPPISLLRAHDPCIL